ncbi:Yip1 family protein [Streptomyces sp. NPDC006274]|uniref:Yip1 family protein n=1 Tax=unclassified Streptomyces TaxID=2593676 RepID=UPI0033AB3963
MNRPKVVVQPPDGRGLREVTTGGKKVGSAWSLRGLRKVLRRLGHPDNVDVEDRSFIVWLGGDSRTWPARPWRRRSTIALMMAGLLGSMVLLIAVGMPDAIGALTFAGRVTGFLFAFAGAVQGVAALAVLDYWGKRQLKFSGAVVLLGVFIGLVVNGLLLSMWLQEREYTPYVLTYLPLWCWSLWAMQSLIREKAWRGIPYPKQFAAGVTATTLLATLNLAYSALYQPTSAPVLFELEVEFGTPQSDAKQPLIHLPVTFRARNSGKVPAYIISDGFGVYGTSAKYASDGSGLMDWRKLSGATTDESKVGRYVKSPIRETISAGRFYGPGNWLEPGEQYVKERVVQLPKSATYDVIESDLTMTIMRKDRGRIDDDFTVPHYSWHTDDKQFYCPPIECDDHIINRGRVLHNNNMINVTRQARHVVSYYGWTGSSADFQAYILSYEPREVLRFRKEAAEEDERERERYGVALTKTMAAIPFAQLLRPNGT